MTKAKVLRIPYDAPIPDGWQDWSKPVRDYLSLSAPRWRAIRGADDAPEPDRAKPVLSRDEIPLSLVDEAREKLREAEYDRLIAAGVPEYVAEDWINNWAWDEAAAWLGEPDAYACEAPLSFRTPEEAADHAIHYPHLGRRTRTALIRRDAKGWRVWVGSGSDMKHLGVVPLWNDAILFAINGVLRERAEEAHIIREHFHGWDERFVDKAITRTKEAPIEVWTDDGHGHDQRKVAEYTPEGGLVIHEHPDEDGPQEIAIVRMARKALGMSQERFGRWLAEQLGRNEPYPQQQVSEWERGLHVPRRSVRALCARVVAEHIAQQAAENARKGGASEQAAQELQDWLARVVREVAA